MYANGSEAVSQRASLGKHIEIKLTSRDSLTTFDASPPTTVSDSFAAIALSTGSSFADWQNEVAAGESLSDMPICAVQKFETPEAQDPSRSVKASKYPYGSYSCKVRDVPEVLYERFVRFNQVCLKLVIRTFVVDVGPCISILRTSQSVLYLVGLHT